MKINKKKYPNAASHEPEKNSFLNVKGRTNGPMKMKTPFVHNQLVNSIVTSQRAPVTDALQNLCRRFKMIAAILDGLFLKSRLKSIGDSKTIRT